MESWLKILMIISTILILWSRIVAGEKFQYLIKFWNIHRYFSYKSGYTIPIFNSLNVLMFFLRVILISIFISIYILPKEFSDFPLYNFSIISGLISTYIALKFLIEKFYSVIINHNKPLIKIKYYDFVGRYKVGFKNLFAVHLYFYLLLILFNPIPSNLIVLISIILITIYLFFFSYYIIKKIINTTHKTPIYFILYLCTFEIAPAFLLFWYAFKF